ncbi:MAG TPA: hypothetical protein VJO15_04810, partial [Dehalococcoidia bacterium]|nr:hypothetical protein [Dehalococcoidia bacterium]
GLPVISELPQRGGFGQVSEPGPECANQGEHRERPQPGIWPAQVSLDGVHGRYLQFMEVRDTIVGRHRA